MNDASRSQGWAICAAAGLAALLFLIGLLNGSYWALAIPVAIVTLFALSLVGWVGFTIATIQVEADASPEILSTDATNTSGSSAAPETLEAADAPASSQTTAEDAA
ncbi:MAG: hypothetical protein JRJ58_10450 [Deltaproteobacteria bacterium]|nr:hypothetical protein [Deltaproteobacteria bacterium]